MIFANLWPPARLRFPKQILRMITRGRSVRSARLFVGGTRVSFTNTNQQSACLMIRPCNVEAFSCFSFRSKKRGRCTLRENQNVLLLVPSYWFPLIGSPVPLLVPHVGPSNKVASDENEPEGTWCKKSRGVKYTAASQILSV